MQKQLFSASLSLVLLTVLFFGTSVKGSGQEEISPSFPAFNEAFVSLLSIEEEHTPIQTEDLKSQESLIQELLTEGFHIKVDEASYAFPAQSKDIILTKTEQGTGLNFSTEFMDFMIDSLNAQVAEPAENMTLLSADETKVSRAEFEGKIVDGREVVQNLTEQMIEAALQKGENESTAVLRKVEGKIINQTGKDLGPLELLAQGRSKFSGSSPDRAFNVRKALNEKFNAILIPPGAEFSYVEWLGPIEYGGWKQAYTIFKGTQLERAPAGGVCQISTTIYRAALDAGLEITEQRNHSLYIIYYEDYGDGIDATVFPGEQDLKFVNNTPNTILMVAQEEGDEDAVVRFFGEDDGRSTEFIGPYTASNQTEESRAAVGELGIGQMAWKVKTTLQDGSQEEKWLFSNYMSIAQQHREPPEVLRLP
ncbi:MAG: VanW family protein [Candidatus Gracilibacteria bacterium]|jgi:vancomycin resistance protein YoaR